MSPCANVRQLIDVSLLKEKRGEKKTETFTTNFDVQI